MTTSTFIISVSIFVSDGKDNIEKKKFKILGIKIEVQKKWRPNWQLAQNVRTKIYFRFFIFFPTTHCWMSATFIIPMFLILIVFLRNSFYNFFKMEFLVNPTIQRKWERENSKVIRKQAKQAEMTGLMANRPIRIKRGKQAINGQRKPNE